MALSYSRPSGHSQSSVRAWNAAFVNVKASDPPPSRKTRWFTRPRLKGWRAFFLRCYHASMEPADSIRRLGFNRWYERQLIEGHAWFISGFICMILIAACVEELSFRGSAWHVLGYVALVLGASAVGIYGIVRYQQILVESERVGERATCP